MKLFTEKTYEELEKRVDKPVTQNEVEEVIKTLRALNTEYTMFRYLNKIQRTIHILDTPANNSKSDLRALIIGPYNGLVAMTASSLQLTNVESNYREIAEALVKKGYTSKKIIRRVEYALKSYLRQDNPSKE